MTVRFKDNSNSVDTVSIESELAQLETVIAALECAQVNPEMASLLYGHEVSVESFGAKVKDTAKKIWEAIVAFFKKLFSSSKKTEEKAEAVDKDLKSQKDIVISEPDVLEEINRFDKVVANVRTFSDLPTDPALWVGTGYTYLPIVKCIDVFVKYLKYKGHMVAGPLMSELPLIERAYDALVKDFSINRTEDMLNDFTRQVVKSIKIEFSSAGKDFNELKLPDQLAELFKLRAKYPNTPAPFNLKDYVIDDPKGNEFSLMIEKRHLKIIDNILTRSSKLPNDFFPEKDQNKYVSLLRNISNICHLYVDYFNRGVEYYEAVLSLRKTIENLSTKTK